MRRRSLAPTLRVVVPALLTVALLLSGCATTPTETAERPDGTARLDPFELRPDLEVYFARVLLRQGDARITQTDAARDEDAGAPRFHYVGAYLGNGLYLDGNLNLALDVGRIFDLETLTDFRVELTQHQLGRPDYTIERDDWYFQWRPARPLAPSHTARFRDEIVEVTPSALSQGRIEVFATDERAVLDPNLFSELRPVQIRARGAGSLRFPAVSGSTSVSLSADGETLSVGNRFTLRNEGTRIVVEPGPGRGNTHYFYRIEGGFRYVNSRGYGKEIRTSPDTVTVYQDGRLYQTFSLVEAE